MLTEAIRRIINYSNFDELKSDVYHVSETNNITMTNTEVYGQKKTENTKEKEHNTNSR